MGCGFYMLHGSIQVYVTELAPRARALAMSLHSASFYLGLGLGPLVYGTGFARAGIGPSLVLGSMALTAVTLICVRWLRRAEGKR